MCRKKQYLLLLLNVVYILLGSTVLSAIFTAQMSSSLVFKVHSVLALDLQQLKT